MGCILGESSSGMVAPKRDGALCRHAPAGNVTATGLLR
jgi:hypothetical protein